MGVVCVVKWTDSVDTNKKQQQNPGPQINNKPFAPLKNLAAPNWQKKKQRLLLKD